MKQPGTKGAGKAPDRPTGAGKAPGRPTGSGKAAAKAPSQRQLRVAEEVRHVLSGVFLRAMFRDPELADVRVTVTEVRVSPDLRNATAFVARLGRSDVAAILPALKRAAPYLRGMVAAEMRLRVAPMLSFQPDDTLENAMHIDALMRRPEVARDLAPPESATESDGPDQPDHG